MFYRKKLVIGILLLAGLTVWYAGTQTTQNTAEVAFLDVGQGDAILVTLPGNVQILTDGGPGDAILAKLGQYLPFYDRTIELIVLTHPHADHARGLIHVLDSYTVERALVSGVAYESGTYRWFIEKLAENNVEVFQAQRGDRVQYNGVPLIEVLSPRESALGRTFSHVHESNVVTKLTLAGTSFLLVGDIEKETERELVTAGVVDDVDVLKVAHQGSKTSSDETFLASALPETAVVSVGRNSYGHPHQEVLDRFNTLGSHILRTDKHGDIVWTFLLE